MHFLHEIFGLRTDVMYLVAFCYLIFCVNILFKELLTRNFGMFIGVCRQYPLR